MRPFERRPKSFAPRGFTLIELVIVVAIMSILAALAAPRYAQSINRFRVKMACDRIAADLRFARQRAKNTGTPQTISFNIATNAYANAAMADIDDPAKTYEVDLSRDPFGVQLANVDFGGAASVTFDMYGQPTTGGQVSISKGQRTLYVVLDAESGRSASTSEEPSGGIIEIIQTPPLEVF